MAPSPRLLVGFAVALALCAGAAVGTGWIQQQGGIADLRPGAADGADERRTLFREVSDGTGLDYSATGSYAESTNQVTNAGAYAVDYDNDGWTDVLAIGGERPVLYENVGGEFRRSNALPALDRPVQTALFFDYDNDGWEDLLLLSLHRQPLFFENDGGTFERTRVGLNQTLSLPTGASAADYDGDGCLDLFIVQMGNWSRGLPSGFHYTVTPGRDNGSRNLLYRGTCSGFANATEAAGIEGTHWSLATSFVDLTGDGRPDVHVANDFGRDALYVNRGDGTFERRAFGRYLNRSWAHLLGPRTNRNAMSSEVADVDGDGHLDLFVTNIYSVAGQYLDGPEGITSQGNNLFLGAQNATFRERSEDLSVRDGGWGWAAAVSDFDNDGDRDLFHTTKHVPITPMVRAELARQNRNASRFVRRHPELVYPRFFERTNQTFFTRGAAAMGFNRTSGTGAARLDFDRDGDLDLAVAQVDGRYYLYENRLRGGQNWLRISVRGGETTALGTDLSITVAGQTHHRKLNGRSDFLSQDSRTIHVGLGERDRAGRIRVVWPNGSVVVLSDVEANQRLVITPGGRVDGDRRA